MKKIILYFLLFVHIGIAAQSELVFVYFNGKPNAASFFSNPLTELSQKSMDRRNALGIPLTIQDAPIEPSYIQNIQNLGFTVTDYSKWLNGVVVTATAAQVTLLQAQSYVQSVESFAQNSQVVVKNHQHENKKFEEFNKTLLTTYNYGSGLNQIEQVNLKTLHLAGYTGNGVSIAVLDTGFPTVNTGSAYQRLWANNKIKGGYNFISKNTDIYNTSLNAHGSYVLGAIGGYIDGVFVGSAPDADFYLYATENAAVEIPEEQIYWIMAAEEADRQGVQIINSSLGYNTFDDPRYNYTYANMNGTKSFIARGAQIATEKGIIVVSSAGNSGQNTWHYITTPADNAKVFTIGAVDNTGVSSAFSSYGPNSLGIVKPDASARGTAAATTYDSSATAASGTSLSAPIASGGIACLLQAIPATTSRDAIKNRLRETASLYPNHTDQMGYGILNFGNALQYYLQNSEVTTNDVFLLYPNPASDFVSFRTFEKIELVEIFDNLGRIIRAQKPENNSINIEFLSKGFYYFKIKTNKKIYIQKLIKK